MKSILAVIENVFAGISIIMVEVKSQSLQQLSLAERVMIMRFAFGGLVLYLSKMFFVDSFNIIFSLEYNTMYFNTSSSLQMANYSYWMRY